MSWHTGRMVLLDFESTGIDPHRDRVVTAAVIEAGGGEPTRVSEWLVKPGVVIPEGATQVHGITTEHAETNGVDAAGAVHEIGEHLVRCTAARMPVVGHNVTYDLTMLRSELIRHDQPDLADQVANIRPVVDTAVIERHLDPFRPKNPNGRRPDDACGSHTLVDCCRLWGVGLSEDDAHGCVADALAAGRLAWRLATDPERFAPFDGRRSLPRINPADYTADLLHDWQIEQKREQAESLAKWLVGQGKPDDVAREWPIAPPPDGWTPQQVSAGVAVAQQGVAS